MTVPGIRVDADGWSHGGRRWFGNPSAADVIGQVDEGGLGCHAERGGNEFGVNGVDQVDQAGVADHSRRIAVGVNDMAEVGSRRCRPAGFGALGDNDR